jgi:hypothetical protein
MLVGVVFDKIKIPGWAEKYSIVAYIEQFKKQIYLQDCVYSNYV